MRQASASLIFPFQSQQVNSLKFGTSSAEKVTADWRHALFEHFQLVARAKACIAMRRIYFHISTVRYSMSDSIPRKSLQDYEFPQHSIIPGNKNSCREI